MEPSDYQPLTANIALGIGAHPDDLDFMAAGTMATLAAAGTEVYYLIITDGSKGSEDRGMTTKALVEMRQTEQRNAARVLGAKDVYFLGYEDGALELTLNLKRDIVRVIRQVKPDVVFGMDPTMVYSAKRGFVNHPDHRAGGQAVMDAVFPLARDHLSFPDLYTKESLEPHKVKTLLLTNFNQPNYWVDISDSLETKLAVLAEHPSQVPNLEAVAERMRRFAADDAVASGQGFSYAEGFVRIDIAA